MKDFFKTMEKLEAEEKKEAPAGAPSKTVKAKTLKPEAEPKPEEDLEEPEEDLEETETEADEDQEDDQEEEGVE